jgi:hypothetical protein
MAPHRLQDAFPEFAKELEDLLLASKEPNLSAQIPQLLITRRCGCEDDFCATFYTKFEPTTRPDDDFRCLELESEEGMIILDVSSGRIVTVEVLFRDDVRKQLRALFP